MTPLSPTRATFHVLAAKASRYNSSQTYGLGRSALPSQGPCQSRPDGGQSATSILGHKSSVYHSILHSVQPLREQATHFPAASSNDDERLTTAFTADRAPPYTVLPSHLRRLSRVAPISEYKRRTTNLSEGDEMKLFSFLKKLRPGVPVSQPPASPATVEPSPPPQSLWKKYMSGDASTPPTLPAALPSLPEAPRTSPPPSSEHGMWRRPIQPETISIAETWHVRPSSSATASSGNSNTDFSCHQGSDVATSTTHSCQCCSILQSIKETYFPTPKDVAPEVAQKTDVAEVHVATPNSTALAPTFASGGSSGEDEFQEHDSVSLASRRSQLSHSFREVVAGKVFPDFQCPPSPSQIPAPRDPPTVEPGVFSIPFPKLSSPAPDRVKAVFSWPIQGPTPPPTISPKHVYIASQHAACSPRPSSSSSEASLGEVRAIHYDDYGVPRFPGVRFDPEHPFSLAPPAEDLPTPPDYIFPSPSQWKADQPQSRQDPEFPPGLPHPSRLTSPTHSRIASPSDSVYVPGLPHPPQAAIGSKVDEPLPVTRVVIPNLRQPRPIRKLDLQGMQRIREWEFSEEELRELGVDQGAPRPTVESLVPHWMLQPWRMPKQEYWEVDW